MKWQGEGLQVNFKQFWTPPEETPCCKLGRRQHFSISYCPDVALLNSLSKTSPFGYSYKN